MRKEQDARGAAIVATEADVNRFGGPFSRIRKLFSIGICQNQGRYNPCLLMDTRVPCRKFLMCQAESPLNETQGLPIAIPQYRTAFVQSRSIRELSRWLGFRIGAGVILAGGWRDRRGGLRRGERNVPRRRGAG